DTATSAAAPPPTPLKRATICGTAVIFTVRAPAVPATAPITTPATQMAMPAGVKESRSRITVQATASTMPTAANQLPPAGAAGRAEELQSDDEADGGQEIDQGSSECHCSFLISLAGCRPLNSSNMRSVTTKPPTTLVVASTTATKPSTIATGVCAFAAMR